MPSKKLWFEVFLDKFPISGVHIALSMSIIIYLSGIIISIYTNNLNKFIMDYPWLIYSVYIAIGIWTIPYVLNSHRESFHNIRNFLLIDDDNYHKFTSKISERLASNFSIIFSLIFFPILFWVSRNRLWWGDYNKVFFYDIYSWIIFSFVLILNGIGIWVGCIAINLNYRDLCKNIPLDEKKLIFQGFQPFKKYFGDLSLKITLLFLVFSTLSNLPLIMLTKTGGVLLNFLIALSLTSIVLVVPQFLFYNLITGIKNKEIIELSEQYEEFSNFTSMLKNNYNMEQNLLRLVYLHIYQNKVLEIREWLIDSKSASVIVISLIISTTIKVFLSDILKPIISFLFQNTPFF